MTPFDRFWNKVDADGDCWLWTAATNWDGYGKVGTGGRILLAHRAAWEFLVGPIPVGMELDHLCRVRSCVNPSHLDVVSPTEHRKRRSGRRVNHPAHDPARRQAYLAWLADQSRRWHSTHRATHCKRGHAFDEANTRVRPTGSRECRACDREKHRLAKVKLYT